MPGCRAPAARAGASRHYNLPTTLTPEQIEESSAAPDTLSFWDLPGYIRAAQAAGFSAASYQLYLYTLYALPALFAAMVFMAASFSLRLAREGGMAKVILFSAACGFGGLFLPGPDHGAGPVRRGADPAGGDRARHRLHPDRHDARLHPGGWLSDAHPSAIRYAAAVRGAAPCFRLIAQAAPDSMPPRRQAAAPAGRARFCCRPMRSIYDSDAKTVSAVGHVEIVDEGRILDADRVDYDQNTDKVTARGHVSITDAARQCRLLRSCGAHRPYARRRACTASAP